MVDKIERFSENPFLDGPAEFLCKATAKQIGLVPEFKMIFGDFIDPYEREDYGTRNLPALRIFNYEAVKEHESHYITGDIHLDIIFPPSIRRLETQQLQDTVYSALLQQFRRDPFFYAMREAVPGLNEYGKVFRVDKTLGMQWEDGIAPITRITANFRLDLKEWDAYLERGCRTKEDPFHRTLGELRRIAGRIDGLTVGEDLESKDVTIEVDQTIQGE